MSPTEPAKPAHMNPFFAAILAAFVVLSAAAVGNVATFAGLQPWYGSLSKPFFTPPNWVFGPAWSVLYLLMTIAFWRVLTRPRGFSGRGVAIMWFVVQMVLNGAWSVAFFGLQSPLLGLFTIGALILALVATIFTFLKVDRPAGLILVPYLAWVAFATALNAGVWWLNR
ncbi:TspO/MBR family protein [Asticcacaulis sp. AC402]|uniref:TspO/MBR family protein n=1 Tax=Asticcacaulis sp. AC402 TaxID=1282361 RepID=UPI0003C3DB3A|nr:TspO/MBR family protein [Asticcacaulis sp. AC402]ESQ75076.1 hypothetical protein ABAC402_10430 [Asticcacaulis sp. AC402]